jgi:flagellar motility protein MotE (MotC chaperone)
MHLKLFVLSASSVVLWLAPLTALDKTLDIHKALQGVSLIAAIACAVSAGNIARELSEQGEIEVIKKRAITADVVDEISTSAYISQQQRQQEAEAILNPVEHLERALALTYDSDERSEPFAQKQLAEREQNCSENEDLITLGIWKFVSRGKQESQPLGLMRISLRMGDENSQMAR